MRKCKVFVGNSHPELGQLICAKLGVEPAPCTLKKFSNGETSVQIGVSVRDEDVYVIQSGSGDINDHIMELLILVSACRGGSAKKITAVIPQFPYSKQSKMKKHRGAITARMLANLLIMAGADHIISMDLHASQMQGFFSKPVDNLYGAPSLAKWIRENVDDYKNAVVVSKNPGGTKRVTALADSLKINFAMIHTDRRRTADVLAQKKKEAKQRRQSAVRRRSSNKRSDTLDEDEVENIILSNGLQTARIDGEIPHDQTSYALGGTYDADDSDADDEPAALSQEKLITLVGNVKERSVIILDDMIDRPGSFIAAAEHCRLNCGAKKVYVVATHGLFIDDCLQELNNSQYIDQVVVTNTYPLTEEKKTCPKLVTIDIAPILAECIRRDHYGESISVLV
ncbi:K00948 ribose-phosphate pyrophosphokinase [Cyberlindnera jadinii]|uniref:Ribose-phosphate pyrophosphokinase 1 n=1 Tax=Cyberlindnera jadinii (strain ATCC 18201 / CBS 1600 / BCRC 20928 / JCM 3617 / NBRC 0987 / NRRL Y-1542) TaxID=983966 RepID=A0A0H5C6J5_CYBJN|nr:K00948 ribose-phosphate pyrophosphokinase [Cyberlindnera jadinii]